MPDTSSQIMSKPTVPAALFILMTAVQSRDLEKVRTALIKVKDDGININHFNRIDRIEYTALQLATKNGDLEIVEELIEAGMNPNIKSGMLLQTPLHLAIMSGQIEIVKFLLKSGADITIKDSAGSTPVHMICIRPLEILQVIVSIPNIDLDVRDYNNRTILFGAIYSATGNKFAEILLQHGADPNIRDRSDSTVLDEVILARSSDDQFELVNLLLQHGANPFIKNKRNETPLDSAKKFGEVDTIKILENYFPSFQILTKRCIRDNKIDVSILPKTITS